MGFASFQCLRKEIVVSLSNLIDRKAIRFFPDFIKGVGKASPKSGFAVVVIEKTTLLFAYIQLNRAYFSNSWHTKTELGLSPSILLFTLVYFSLFLHIQPLVPIQPQILSFPGNFPNFQSAHPLFLLWACKALHWTFCKTSIPYMLTFIAHICFHLSYSTCAIRIEFSHA